MQYKKLLPTISILVILAFGAAKLTRASQTGDEKVCECDDCKQQDNGHDDDSHDGHDHGEGDHDHDSHDGHEHDAEGDHDDDGHGHAANGSHVDEDVHKDDDGHKHAADGSHVAGDAHKVDDEKKGDVHAEDEKACACGECEEQDNGHDDESHDECDHAEGEHDDDSHEGHDHAADGSHVDEDVHKEDDGHKHAADGSHVAEDAHTADDGHDHDADDAHTADDGHDHGAEKGHLAVEMSQADMKKYGIEVARAGAGEIEVHVSVPGEIVINTDRMAHIVPRVPGVVREVTKKLGDKVKKGEVIAWLESTKLGGAKLDYLSKQAEIVCCSMDLARAQEVNDNTVKLLEALKKSPSLEELRKFNGSAMGMNRSLLVSAYSESIFAREQYLREKELYEKQITSKDDFLKAQSAFKKAEAQYDATVDSVGYDVQYDLQEAKRTQHVRQIELRAAQQRLIILGLTSADVEQLAALAQIQSPEDQEGDQCSDPNCKECLAKAAAKAKGIATIEFDLDKASEKMAWYPIIAPFEGTVISKHITLGETVGDDSDVFIIADLGSVWADLRVYQKDAAKIRKGQKVVINGKSSMPVTVGVIDYVEPVINEKTRTALARVVLDNASGKLRPGTFVTAKVTVDKSNAKLVVDKGIIQNVDDKSCVFVQEDHGFELREVTTGQSNGCFVEITSGLKAGETVVVKNSFRLKAELTKGAGGAHAGHSH